MTRIAKFNDSRELGIKDDNKSEETTAYRPTDIYAGRQERMHGPEIHRGLMGFGLCIIKQQILFFCHKIE